jgi:hypothetical protein
MESGESGGSEGMEDTAEAEAGMEDSEPVFEEGDMGASGAEVAGGSSGAEDEALPDFSEEESLEESLENFEEAMEQAAAEAAEGGSPASGSPASDSPASGSPASGMPGSEGDEQGANPGGGNAGAGESGTEPSGSGSGQQNQGYGAAGSPAGGYPGGPQGGNGPLTGAEQVAILDEQLNRGTGDFDDIILRERETIRRTAKSAPDNSEAPEAATASGGYGSGDYSVPPMASTGAGQGGGPGPPPRASYDGDIPAQTSVYPPPADLPSGNDDDVVARQLREAAMREPDPKLREKLWDEYRKYKGIE